MWVKLTDGTEVNVKVIHHRPDLSPDKIAPIKIRNVFLLHSLPGTDVLITRQDGYPAGEASSFCAPPDRYNKKKGTRIALARAMRSMRLSREDRKRIWAKFGLTTPKSKKKKKGNASGSGRMPD